MAIETTADGVVGGSGRVLGHATLAGAARVRMAGEVFYDRLTGEWVVMNSGGRYAVGGRVPHTPRQVENVGEMFRKAGLRVRVDYSPL